MKACLSKPVQDLELTARAGKTASDTHRMRYGNTAQHLRRVLMVGLVTGAVGYLFCAAMMVFYEHRPLERLIPLTFILVVPALVMAIAISPTLFFSIHIVGDYVEHRMLDRWVLSRARVLDFVSMETPSGFFAAELRFADGTKMRFFGAHLGIIASLEAELRRRTAEATPSQSRNSEQLD